MKKTETVGNLLKELAENKAPVFLSTDDVDIVFQTTILSMTDDKLVLENRVPIEHITRFVESKKFFIQAQLLRLEADRIESNGQNIVFSSL